MEWNGMGWNAMESNGEIKCELKSWNWNPARVTHWELFETKE